ncbi:hypothetical protein E2320_013221, partial [Naja naja]
MELSEFCCAEFSPLPCSKYSKGISGLFLRI